MRAALDDLAIDRIGHGVRSVEDPELVARLADGGVLLEVCPTSNVAIGLYPDHAAHPFPRLRAAGCRVTLNFDDPPYFDTSIGREYEVAPETFGLGPGDLLAITRGT